MVGVLLFNVNHLGFNQKLTDQHIRWLFGSLRSWKARIDDIPIENNSRSRESETLSSHNSKNHLSTRIRGGVSSELDGQSSYPTPEISVGSSLFSSPTTGKFDELLG